MRHGWFSLILLAALAVAGGGCATTWDGARSRGSHAYVSASVGAYYDDLAPYGTWLDLDPYGWVWCPLDVSSSWRPYTIGMWVYTDDGWMWISEDPWGDIPYHYGRWAFDRDYGWVWVPGDVWAPAWVAWRYGDGWVGWAPLPPDVRWQIHVGLVYSAFDLDRHIHRHHWCYSRARDFGATRVRVKVEPSGKNVTLHRVTKDVTKYGIVGDRPVERGLRPEWIEQESNRKVERYRVTDTEKPRKEPGTAIRDRSVEVYRPEGGITEVVRERVRDVPAEERPVPPPKAIERLEKEREQFEEQARIRREQLIKEHEKEVAEKRSEAATQRSEAAERRSEIAAQELRKRQEAEMRAQREAEERERRAVEERERLITKERDRRSGREESDERGKSEERGRRER